MFVWRERAWIQTVRVGVKGELDMQCNKVWGAMKTVENTEGITTSKEREIEVYGGGNETEGGGDKLTLATVGRWWVSSKLGTEERSSKKNKIRNILSGLNSPEERTENPTRKDFSEFHRRYFQHPEMRQVLGELRPPDDFSPIVLIGLFLS
jgi:hypothetical protein